MLLGFNKISLNIGNTALLDQASFSIERGERLCLLGRNGMGKSTLFRILMGEQSVDNGEVVREQGVRLAKLMQDVPSGMSGTVFDVVAEGLGEIGRVLAEYHHLLHDAPDDLVRMGKLQSKIEANNAWTLDERVQVELDRQKLDGEAAFADLSGGLKRRTLLARALVADPDVLLLDEPTNHLDITSITALEEFLAAYEGTLIFITHDRAFLRRLATRIIELDRGWLTSWPCHYDEYLRRKAEALHAEAKHNAVFDKKLAQEEVWIRRGIEARRTRDQGRVKRLMEMRRSYGERRNLQGQAKMEITEAERSGKLVAEAKGVSMVYDGRTIIRSFSTTILRGDKLGIIGPNGAGKTTLINLLLGKLQATGGELRLGSNLQVAYFDQLRATLDENKTVAENIGDGKEFVEINGVRKHVMSYLQEFLFAPDRARQPVRSLSGGERNRLLLAQLFSRPSNLLVMDEPTNDLDVETLDLLEELLQDYSGTVLVVSHDREFINNVVTRCLVFEGGGTVNEYIGGYEDWLRQRPQSSAAPVLARANPVSAAIVAPSPAAPRLSSKEQKELSELPGRIEKWEAQQSALGEELSQAYADAPDKVTSIEIKLKKLAADLAQAYARWEFLEKQRT